MLHIAAEPVQLSVSSCSCAAGMVQCSRLVAMLYQSAHFCMMRMRSVHIVHRHASTPCRHGIGLGHKSCDTRCDSNIACMWKLGIMAILTFILRGSVHLWCESICQSYILLTLGLELFQRVQYFFWSVLWPRQEHLYHPDAPVSPTLLVEGARFLSNMHLISLTLMSVTKLTRFLIWTT